MSLRAFKQLCYLDWAKTTSYTACSSLDSLSWCTSHFRSGRDTWNSRHLNLSLSRRSLDYPSDDWRCKMMWDYRSPILNPSRLCLLRLTPDSRLSYQGFSCSIHLIFGASEQETSGQDVESLSASPRAVVHLSFPQFELIKRRTMQKPVRWMSTDVFTEQVLLIQILNPSLIQVIAALQGLVESQNAVEGDWNNK